MTTMPVEIFSDHIDDDKESPKSNKSLSKMNKTELYQFSKELVKENMRLQLFVNSTDELHKHNENTKLDMSKKIKELEKDNIENVERIEFLEKQYMKLKEDNKKLKDDLHWKDNDLYYANKSNNSNKEWGEYQLKLKKELEEDNKLKDGIISLHEQGLSRDDVEVEELKDKIVEQDVEISNLKLELEEAKSYEKSFNEVKANKDDIEEDLSEEINDLQKEIEELKEKHCTVCLDYDKLAEDYEELKEKDKKAKEIFKLMGEWYEDNIIGHLPESEEEDEEENE